MSSHKKYHYTDRSNDPETDPRERLVEVEDEILQLEAQLCKRLDQRRELKRQINTQFSPLLRLPSDLLSEISFTMFPEGDIATWDSATPLLFGSVCRTWRDLTWHTPRLWCTMPMKVGAQYTPMKVTLLREWLLRSRQLPISVHLSLGRPRESHDVDIMWQIMEIIANCSDRWQHVDLDIPYFFNKDLCLIPTGFSQLRSLRISNLVWNFPQHLGIFEHATNLHEVSLPGYMGALLPKYSLSHLTVGYATVQECLMLLERHPNLLHCVFTSITPPGSTQLLPIVNALSLRSLKLMFTHAGSEGVSVLFDKLSAPSLGELELSMNRDTPIYNALISLIQRSSCQLTCLGLFGVNISEAQLAQCFAVLPSLKELKLWVETFGTKIMNELTIGTDSEPTGTLLPNLVSLNLTLRPESKDLFIALVRLVRSRRRQQRNVEEIEENTKIRAKLVVEMESLTVVAEAGSVYKPTVLAQLQELEEEGICPVLKFC